MMTKLCRILTRQLGREPTINELVAFEERLAHRRDADIMLARTHATQRGATPAEVQRNVQRFEEQGAACPLGAA